MRLVRPSAELFSAFVAMADDYARDGDDYYSHEGGWTPSAFAAYLARLDRYDRGLVDRAEHVPESTYWLVRDDDRIVAVGRVRHRLTPALLRRGGHIGYDVAPSERGKGHGRELLGRLLVEARTRGLRSVLLTCDESNVASRRVIERHGGRLESREAGVVGEEDFLRFWIDLGP